jgi:hypothetical protein
MESRIVEAFGRFMAELDGQIVTFEDKASAEIAVAMAEGKEDMEMRAAAYCDARELQGKNAVAKSRIVIDFMAFEAVEA